MASREEKTRTRTGTVTNSVELTVRVMWLHNGINHFKQCCSPVNSQTDLKLLTFCYYGLSCLSSPLSHVALSTLTVQYTLHSLAIQCVVLHELVSELNSRGMDPVFSPRHASLPLPSPPTAAV
ncbi:hypothetical protein J6590_035421 [Homalodisca vitripennis]|nr:hypothetical protein J6590_035421 [Homalodisca vitripennis]